jgi:hypothetical protein
MNTRSQTGKTPAPATRYEDEAWAPGSNNSPLNSGRPIDTYDCGFDPHKRGMGFQARGIGQLPTLGEIQDDLILGHGDAVAAGGAAVDPFDDPRFFQLDSESEAEESEAEESEAEESEAEESEAEESEAEESEAEESEAEESEAEESEAEESEIATSSGLAHPGADKDGVLHLHWDSALSTAPPLSAPHKEPRHLAVRIVQNRDGEHFALVPLDKPSSKRRRLV